MKLNSNPLALGIAALASVLVLPLLVAVTLASGIVLRWLAVLGLATFCASLPLACISWWMGSRALAVHSADAEANGTRQALLARTLGRSTVLVWALLVVLAALTYTRGATE
jgi:hypothetical protein